MGYVVVREFSEKISGAKKVEEREALMELLSYVDTHPVVKVLIYECSRLSRRAVDFLSVIEPLSAQKVSVYIHQNGLETLLPNGTPNPIAQLVLGILAQFNSMERSLIRSLISKFVCPPEPPFLWTDAAISPSYPQKCLFSWI